MAEPEPGSLRVKQVSAVLAPAKKEEIRKHVKELLSDDFRGDQLPNGPFICSSIKYNGGVTLLISVVQYTGMPKSGRTLYRITCPEYNFSPSFCEII